MALTYEQFKKAKESGLSTEKIVQFEKRRTKESQVGQKIQTQTEQPSSVLSNVLGATKAVGGFLGGLAKDITKPVASSIVSPIQLAKTAKNYYGDEDVQKRRFEAMRGIDPDKQAKHTDDLYKALKTAETDEEKASIAKLMQEDINKYVKGIQEKPIKEEVDTSVTLPFYGEIEAPKTAKEVAGRAIETVALGAGGTAKAGATAGKSLFKRALTGPGSKIGATYGAGSALSENKSLGETAIQAGIGGILGGATDLALIGGGKGLQKLGEKIQKPTAETKLSLGEKAASSIINSLIKPLKKDFAYGKNPGLSVAREKITANSWDDLVTKIGKARTKTGKEIGSFYKDNVDGKTTVNLSNSLKSIDETIKKAASENNQSVINRLEDVKNAITKKLVPAKDEAGKTIIKTAGKKRLYNIKPSNAQSIIEKIGGMTKFTGNVSDDNMVNKALKKVYGSARNELESSIKKVDESLYSKIRQLNEHYGNITSADIAAKNREMIVQRANLMGLAPEVISGTSIVGGLASGNPIAIIGGIMTAMGNQAMKSPAIKTRLASMLAGASNKERISIFAKYPALKSLKENVGVGLSKTGEVISKIPGIAEEAPRKSVQSLMEAARTKMPIGMTIKDVSKEGFSKAGVPQKLEQEARKAVAKSVDNNPIIMRTSIGDEKKVYRLKDFADKDGYVYHTTSPNNLDGIKESGLKASDGYQGKAVYFAPDEASTIGQASYDGATVRVNVNKLTPKNIISADVNGFGEPTELVYAKNILPEAIEIKTKNGWQPIIKTKSQLEEIWNKANQKEIPYKETGSLTTKLLKKLEGRTTVNKQFISDLTNSPDLKQTEKDLIRAALKGEDSKINVTKFAEKVKAELLPLKRINPNTIAGDSRYENISLPSELRGNVANYSEHIYQSPIKTSAGDVHFSGGNSQNYFGHTRIEDMADNKTRRVIEVQSDLYQKGNLEKEMPYPYKAEAKASSPEIARQKVMGDKSSDAKTLQKRVSEVEKLQQYNDPTAHFRMVREEIAQAAKDKKTKVQFPTGETAMKIEGLGTGNYQNWKVNGEQLTPEKIKEGLVIKDARNVWSFHVWDDCWVITDVLDDGKFKATPLSQWEKYSYKVDFETARKRLYGYRPDTVETFDISGKVDTNNPIYKFYEKEMGKYLKSKYNAKEVIDDQGVSWYEVDIKPDMKGPIEAFGIGAIPLATQINQDKK